MDMNRNALFWKPEEADQEDIARMTRFWGDEFWKQVAWVDSKQGDIFGATEQEKQSNKVIAEAFRERLKKVAGFAHVPEPLPMTNKKNAVIYYLFFAAKNPTAGNIIADIFKRAREGSLPDLDAVECSC